MATIETTTPRAPNLNLLQVVRIFARYIELYRLSSLESSLRQHFHNHDRHQHNDQHHGVFGGIQFSRVRYFSEPQTAKPRRPSQTHPNIGSGIHPLVWLLRNCTSSNLTGRDLPTAHLLPSINGLNRPFRSVSNDHCRRISC